jgi:hypothetical protein
MSTSKAYHLEEISGDQFPSLTSAQQASFGILADVLTDTVRVMLQNGMLTVENGIIVPNRHLKKN